MGCEDMREDINKRIEQIENGLIPLGYKKTRIGIIPNEWSVSKVSSFLVESKKLSNDIQKYPLFSSSRKGLIKQSDYYSNRIAVETNLGYKIVPPGFITYRHMSDDDIFFFNVNNTGTDILVSSEYPVFTTKGMDLTYFIEHINNMARFLYFCRSQKQGGTRTRLYFRILKEYTMPIPPKDQQKDIAILLNYCDKIIELKRQLIEEERKREKWLMQELLTPSENAETALGAKQWVPFTLKENGTTYSGLSGKSEKDFGDGKPYIPYLNIFSNKVIDEQDFDYVSIGEGEKQNKVKYGDIFFTTSSETPQEVGMSSVYMGDSCDLYLNSFSFGYRLKNFNKLLPEFAAYYFRSIPIKHMLYRLAQGATRYNLSKSNLVKQTVQIPATIQAQKETAKLLMSADTHIDLLTQELSQWQQKKKALMQLLLTGLVRV